MVHNSHVTIIMGVHNGERFLLEMLNSLSEQEHSNWSLLVGDDASVDSSLSILRDFAARQRDGQVQLRVGPNRGYTMNYLSLLAELDTTTPTWLAFADQDDVWLPHRLSAGLNAIGELTTAALSAGPVWSVPADLRRRTISGGWPGATGFNNALIQNVVQGNTTLANPDATRLLILAARAAMKNGKFPVTHDWWSYQIVTGAGGQVVKASEATVLYRQHANNAIGDSRSTLAKLHRLAQAYRGRQREWIATNCDALNSCIELLTPESQRKLSALQLLRATSCPLQRMRALLQLRPTRQTAIGTAIFWAAAILGRL